MPLNVYYKCLVVKEIQIYQLFPKSVDCEHLSTIFCNQITKEYLQIISILLVKAIEIVISF